MHRSWAQVGRLPLSEILEIHPLEQVLAQKSCYKQGEHGGGGGDVGVLFPQLLFSQ